MSVTGGRRGVAIALLVVIGVVVQGSCSRAMPGAPERQAVTIPFELVRNQIVLEISIGGLGPFSVILDTAVNPSAVDLATATETGLAVDRDRPVAAAADMGPLAERLGRPLHGVLGYSFLRTKAVLVSIT